MNDECVPYPATIVIDANTLISATLTPGITREMLLATEDELYSPAFIRAEISFTDHIVEITDNWLRQFA